MQIAQPVTEFTAVTDMNHH